MRRRRICRSAQPRHGSIYFAVAGVAMIVSMVGLTVMQIARLELRAATARQDRSYARTIAQSSVEMALARIDHDSDWRLNFNHGQLYSASPSGAGVTLRFKYLDNADSDLADDDAEVVEIQGIGSYGGATFLYSTTYAPSVTTENQVGPLEIHSHVMDSGNSSSVDTINRHKWYGQYFVPGLPAEAIEWRVTEVDIYVRQSGPADTDLHVKLYQSSGGLPGSFLKSTSVAEGQLPSGSFDWYTVSLANSDGLSPGQGVCLTLEGTSNSKNAAEVQYQNGGVAVANSHLLQGGQGSPWSSGDTDKALFYRIRGVYTTPTGGHTITPGSWRRTAVP
ncbi:MAG: hypothetical protein MI725_00405 [Pirellulales bacterium]|nr:hypothetical protein [Pirellulales bacterium]